MAEKAYCGDFNPVEIKRELPTYIPETEKERKFGDYIILKKHFEMLGKKHAELYPLYQEMKSKADKMYSELKALESEREEILQYFIKDYSAEEMVEFSKKLAE